MVSNKQTKQDAFEFNGKNVVPSQCNNMFIFPGIGLAATVGKCRIITDAMIYKASIALSDSLTQAEENEGRIFPDVSRIRDVSFKVACAVYVRSPALIHINSR